MTTRQIEYRLKARVLFFVLLSLVFLQTSPALGAGAEKAISLVLKDQILETSTNRMWLADRSKKLDRVEDAESYLNGLNQGVYDDWRLPTKQELYDLFSVFDLKQNGDVKIRLEGYYWLLGDNNSKYVGGWQVGDGCGPSRSFYKGTEGYVRAIRP